VGVVFNLSIGGTYTETVSFSHVMTGAPFVVVVDSDDHTIMRIVTILRRGGLTEGEIDEFLDEATESELAALLMFERAAA
jgi:hypothetical protein